MKNKIKYTLFFLILLLAATTNVTAKEKLATCTYDKYVHTTTETMPLVFVLYDDKSVDVPYDIDEEGNVDAQYNSWYYSPTVKSFKKDWGEQLYKNNKLAANCPKITVCHTSGTTVQVYANGNSICSDGSTPQKLDGTLKVEKTETPVEEDKSQNFCTKRQTLKNPAYTIDVSFFLNSEGNKMFSVLISETNNGGEDRSDGIISVGTHQFQINQDDIDAYYGSVASCEKSAMYFELINGTYDSILITTKKPNEVNDGSDGSGPGQNTGGSTGGSAGSSGTIGAGTVGCDILGGKGSQTVDLLSWFVRVIRFGVPILIIILGIMDFLQILFSGEDKVYKEAFARFVKRLLIGICIIFIPYFIQLVIMLSGVDSQYGIDDFFCGIIDATSGVKANTTGGDTNYDDCDAAGHIWNSVKNVCVTGDGKTISQSDCIASGYKVIRLPNAGNGYFCVRK